MNKPMIDLSRANKPTAPVSQEPAAPPAAEPVQPVARPENKPKAVRSAPKVVAAPPPAAAPMLERASTIGARIPQSLHQDIKIFCVTQGIEIQRFVHDALTNHLAALQGELRE